MSSRREEHRVTNLSGVSQLAWNQVHLRLPVAASKPYTDSWLVVSGLGHHPQSSLIDWVSTQQLVLRKELCVVVSHQTLHLHRHCLVQVHATVLNSVRV